jgi:hypothetical protein
MTPEDRARDQAQRELWDVINRMSLRRQTKALDLESWASALEQTRTRLLVAAQKAREAELTVAE